MLFRLNLVHQHRGCKEQDELVVGEDFMMKVYTDRLFAALRYTPCFAKQINAVHNNAGCNSSQYCPVFIGTHMVSRQVVVATCLRLT